MTKAGVVRFNGLEQFDERDLSFAFTFDAENPTSTSVEGGEEVECDLEYKNSQRGNERSKIDR